jgi:hypothetical protein
MMTRPAGLRENENEKVSLISRKDVGHHNKPMCRRRNTGCSRRAEVKTITQSAIAIEHRDILLSLPCSLPAMLTLEVYWIWLESWRAGSMMVWELGSSEKAAKT